MLPVPAGVSTRSAFAFVPLPTHAMVWAVVDVLILELRKTGKLTLSDTEREKLYEIIKSEETMTNIFKAQILKSLKKVENADVDH